MTNNTQTNDDHTSAVRAILAQEIPKDVSIMKSMLRDLEMRYTAVIEVRIQAEAELAQRRLQYLHPKDAQYTDFDRKIMLEGNIAEYKAEYDRAQALEDALKQRLDIIVALLRLC